MITEHAICTIPEGHSLWRHFAIKVQRKGSTDEWVLIHCGYYLVPNGEWSPDARAALRFDEKLALEVAEHWAPRVESNGRTAYEAMEAGLL
ncbi:hypothetical protein [Paractinoplanes toevensis]|uniref:Uncharacterized protein n=1 Tax=Paractinoplanes toevensis TaxID=571911 RepID=A0A919W056_9ACTN|nr:hypothetical protein [Actinoplanes toevensis]GIM88804.1 hypothetical protein Ato02nite_005970 [Actinoplanes toevensis]